MLRLWRKRPRSHILHQISQFTSNYSLTLSLLKEQGRQDIQNKDINYLIGGRIKSCLKAIYTKGVAYEMNYILEEKDGKIQCGPIVITVDFGDKENKYLNLLKYSRRYSKVEKISDEYLSTLKIQSSRIRNKCSFEIFAYPRLNNGDAQEFFGAAMKFLKYARLSQHSRIPMVQLRQLSGGGLRSSVLYYPPSTVECYRCVLMRQFHYKMFIRKGCNSTNMVAMKPIDISHHLRVADNKNVMCIAQLCPSVKSNDVKEVLPEAYKIFRLYDKARTFYVSFAADQNMSEIIEKAKEIDNNAVIYTDGILFDEDELPSTSIIACFRTNRYHISPKFISSTFSPNYKIKEVKIVKNKDGEIRLVLVEFDNAVDAIMFMKSRHSKPGEYLRYALYYPNQGSSVFCDNLDVKNSRLMLYDYVTQKYMIKKNVQKIDEKNNEDKLT